MSMFEYAILLWFFLEILTITIGGCKFLKEIIKHPKAHHTWNQLSLEEIEEMRKFTIDEIDKNFYFPHQAYLMRMQINDIINKQIKIKKAR